MGAMAIVQTEVDAELEKRAADVLEREGLTVAEAVREMLILTANKGTLPFSTTADEAGAYGDDNPGYDAWFRAKVQEALDDPRPYVSNEEAKRRVAVRRAELLARAR
jgi:DNA-damage-inducible protein J